MAKQSAGLLFYRIKNKLPEILLVHPGGPFWAKKDLGAWSIPKGEIEDGESALSAAIREVQEETGIQAEGIFTELTPIKQKSGKMVHAWAVEKDVESATVRSNEFEMEWPPRSGTMRSFPEIDKAGWFNFDEAAGLILEAQIPLIHELKKILTRIS